MRSLTEYINTQAMAQQDKAEIEALSYQVSIYYRYSHEGLFAAYEMARAIRTARYAAFVREDPVFHGRHGQCVVVHAGPVPEHIHNDIEDIFSDFQRERGAGIALDIASMASQAEPVNTTMRDKLMSVLGRRESPFCPD